MDFGMKKVLIVLYASTFVCISKCKSHTLELSDRHVLSDQGHQNSSKNGYKFNNQTRSSNIQFERPFYSVATTGGRSVSHKLLQLKLTRNEESLKYHIIRGHPDFFLNRSGELYVSPSALRGHYKLYICASSENQHCLASTVVNVKILDRAKRKSTLTFVFVLPLNASGDLFSLGAQEDIPSTKVTFEFVEKVDGLEVDSSSGLIRANDDSWHGNEKEMTLKLLAKSDNDPDQEIDVRVHRVDRGIYSHIFVNEPRPLQCVIPGIIVGDKTWIRPETTILTLQAIDAVRFGARVTYKLEAGGDGRFTVDPVTGEVKTVGRSSFQRSGSYQLAISANVVGIVDGGVPLTQVVHITNGNLSPQFFLEEYVINMDEFSEDSIPTEGDPIAEVKVHSFYDLGMTFELIPDEDANGAKSRDLFRIYSPKTPKNGSVTTGLLLPVTSVTKISALSNPRQFRYKIKATEHTSKYYSTVQLIVNVIDINDHAPFFLSSFYTRYNVSESTAIGTKLLSVSAIDRDEGDNALLEFQIDNDDLTIIQVDNYTADIIVARELNSNNQPGRRYEVDIRAIDAGTPRRNGSATIHLRMINSNNKPPIFEPPNQVAYIRDQLAAGKLVHVVQAYDPDGNISPFKYKLNNNYNLFSIDEDSGHIKLTKKYVSNETKRETFVLEVELHDGVNPPSTDNVTIYTMGINRPPVFINCKNALIEENQDIGTKVVTIEAFDPDSGASGEMVFHVEGGEEEDKAFNVKDFGDGTADLITKVKFDREDPTNVKVPGTSIYYEFERIGNKITYPVTVKVEDKNQNPLRSYCSFLVTIVDVNDNGPEFDINRKELSEYHRLIPMNPTLYIPLYRAFALDRDEGENSIVVYSLTNINCEDCFAVNNDGYITAQKDLKNVLENSELDVIVRVNATDRPSVDTPPGTPSSYLNITLRRSEQESLKWHEVDGVDLDVYILNVNENHKGPVGPQLAVTDANGWNVMPGRYPENNHGGTFSSKMITCEVGVDGRCGRLEKTSAASPYPLRYIRLLASRKVENLGNSGSNKRVQVKFKPMNLYAPKFSGRDSLQFISAFVSTETVSGDHVTQIFAYDTDSDKEYNEVRYMFAEGCKKCSRFLLHEETGEITANDSFENDKGSITLTVYAQDSPKYTEPCAKEVFELCHRKSAEQKIDIKIAAPLSETPRFPDKASSVSIDEGFYPPRKNVIKINVTYSGSERAEVKHGIISGNDDHIFAVDAKDGQIYQVGELEFDPNKPLFELTVGVFYGEQMDTTNVNITIIERPCLKLYTFGHEREEPIFYQRSRTEHDNSNMFVVDVGKAGPDVDYQLVGPLAYGFKLEGSQVLMSEPLDRDYPNGYSDWQVNVEAVCKGRKDDDPRTFAIVSLLLIDINDNSPVFDTTKLKGMVKENSSTQTHVMDVLAVDYDEEGINSKVMYSIVEGGNKFGNVENAIKTKTTFNRLEKDSYRITVQAKDQGDQGQGSGPVKQYIWIDIEDMNLNSPKFQSDTDEVSVPENLPPGSSVVAVFAEDKDIGDNALRKYTVKEQPGNHFTMDSIRSTGYGVVKINEVIDYEKLQDKTLPTKVRVTGPGPNDVDVASVKITITDVNDNHPLVCPKGSLGEVNGICPERPTAACIADKNMTVMENRPQEYLVAEIEGCDADTGSNAIFDYTIDYENTDEEKKFKVEHDSSNRRNGRIRLRNLLDREVTEEYILHILAVDRGEPPLTGTSTVRIIVGDVNDNAPEFEDPDTWRVVRADTSPNTLVGSWKIIDRDSEEHGPPFKVNTVPNDDNTKLFEENFHWDYQPGTYMLNVKTKNSEYKRTASLKRYTASFKLEDRGQMADIRKLVIQIEDINDHRHQSGQKSVTLYSYQGLFTNVWLGHVFVEDEDDWDRAEKNYELVQKKDGFRLGQTAKWDLFMDLGVNPTKHTVEVQVTDPKWQGAAATALVEVDVKFIYEEAIDNLGSMRLEGISPEGLIAGTQNKLASLKKEIATLVRVNDENYVQILNIRKPEGQTLFTDIYYAVTNSKGNYLRPARLDGNIWNDKTRIEKALDTGHNIKIRMSPINECGMMKCWRGSCSNVLVFKAEPVTINTNRTSYVGINVTHEARCQCDSHDFPPQPEVCTDTICLNGGTCQETWANVRCLCPKGFEGPRCQQSKISFTGSGVAWFSPLTPCYHDVIRFQFATNNKSQQVLLFNGPLDTTDPSTHLAVQLDSNGKAWFSVDMGSGGVSASLSKGAILNDGKWHTIEISKEGQKFRMTVDYCEKSVLVDSDQREDRSPCEVAVAVPGDDLVFALTTPLQLGGVKSKSTMLPGDLGKHGLDGCIKDVFHNGQYIDLHIGEVGQGENITPGCPKESTSASTFLVSEYTTNQTCVGDLNGNPANCRCQPMNLGTDCSEDTIIRDYRDPAAYLEWNMKAGPTKNKKDFLQMSFRTRQTNGMLFFAQSETTMERFFLEIKESHLTFTYDLGKGDNVLSLRDVQVDDGLWHTALVRRLGSKVILDLDCGEGRYHGEIEAKDNLPNLSLSGKNYAGGADVKYRRFHSSPTVTSSIFNSQLTDVRFSSTLYPDARLAMTTAENSEGAGQLEDDHTDKITIGPAPNPTCDIKCRSDQICVDAWRHFFCGCLANQTEEKNECVALTGCSVMKCDPGICVPQSDGTGECYNVQPELLSAKAALAPAALGIIIACLILMLLLLLLSTITQRKKKQPDGDYLLDPELENHTRENIVQYCEEGSGEELPVKSDLPALLRIPMTSPDNEPQCVNETIVKGAPYSTDSPALSSSSVSPYSPDVVGLIMKNKETVDDDPACNASDYYLPFEEEGSASLATSLSSLQSSDTGDQNYDYLQNLGPRFQKLADIYGESDDDSETASFSNSGVRLGSLVQSPADSEEEEALSSNDGYPRQRESYNDYGAGREPTFGDQPQDQDYLGQYSPLSSGFSELNQDVPRNDFGNNPTNGYDNAAFSDPRYDENGQNGAGGEGMILGYQESAPRPFFGSGNHQEPTNIHLKHSFLGVPGNDVSDV